MWDFWRAGLGATVAVFLLVAVTGNQAGASARVNATGGAECGVGSGTIKFDPPITLHGNSATEVIKGKVRSNTPCGGFQQTFIPRSGDVNLTITVPTSSTKAANSCSSINNPMGEAVHEVIKWKESSKGVKVYPSVITFPNVLWGLTSYTVFPPHTELSLFIPNNGEEGSNNGTSYSGSDHGFDSSTTLYLDVSPVQFAAVCGANATGKLSSASLTSDAGDFIAN